MESGLRVCFVLWSLALWIDAVTSFNKASGGEREAPATHHTPTEIMGVRRGTVPKAADRRGEQLVCTPCWEGDTCQHYADHYGPRFLVHAATVVLSTNSTGVVYRTWSTDEDLGLTCPLGPGYSARCPCAAVAYQLYAPPGDHHFQMDAVTGILTRNTSMMLMGGEIYTYKIMVQSIPVAGQSKDLLFDLLDLKIYVRPDFLFDIPWS